MSYFVFIYSVWYSYVVVVIESNKSDQFFLWICATICYFGIFPLHILIFLLYLIFIWCFRSWRLWRTFWTCWATWGLPRSRRVSRLTLMSWKRESCRWVWCVCWWCVVVVVWWWFYCIVIGLFWLCMVDGLLCNCLVVLFALIGLFCETFCFRTHYFPQTSPNQDVFSSFMSLCFSSHRLLKATTSVRAHWTRPSIQWR